MAQVTMAPIYCTACRFNPGTTNTRTSSLLLLGIILQVEEIAPEYEVLLAGSVDAAFCIWDVVFHVLVQCSGCHLSFF